MMPIFSFISPSRRSRQPSPFFQINIVFYRCSCIKIFKNDYLSSSLYIGMKWNFWFILTVSCFGFLFLKIQFWLYFKTIYLTVRKFQNIIGFIHPSILWAFFMRKTTGHYKLRFRSITKKKRCFNIWRRHALVAFSIKYLIFWRVKLSQFLIEKK